MAHPRITPGLLVLLLALSAMAVPDRSGVPGAAGDPLYFDMSIADESGAVLATPRLVGLEGKSLQMTLAKPSMSLEMSPELVKDGSYEICFEISMPGRVEKGRGRLKLRSGEEKRTRVSYPGGHLDVRLAAFNTQSPEFKLLMQYGAAQHPTPST
jgi:hypothetical protein